MTVSNLVDCNEKDGKNGTVLHEHIDGSAINPLLKWAGGKRLLLKKIIPLLPKNYEKYYEPFFGGGALFFALQPSNAKLSDNNEDLMNCYIQVRDNPELVIEYLSQLENSEYEYYRIRNLVPADNIERAARLIYLTTLSFNGIHRQNLKGEFNVPYGYKTHINPCDELKIRSVSKVLNEIELECSDFESSVSTAGSGDLIYFDPPYTLSNGESGFVKYNSKVFTWDDQVRLSEVAGELVNRGCHVIVSNANHPAIVDLYPNFRCVVVERPSVIAASGKYRRKIEECIFVGECV